MLTVEVHNEINGNTEVMEYLQASAGISVFQTNYFLDLFDNSERPEGIFFVCKKENKITGVLLVQLQDYFRGLPGFLTRRAIIIGGPYTEEGDTDSAKALIRKYLEYIGKKVVYTQVRRLYQNGSDNSIFTENGFQYFDHLDYIIELSRGEETCWKNLNQKRRNEVRKAIKVGITFAEIDYAHEMDKAYDILKKIYERAKLPLPEKDYFHKAYGIMGGQGIFKIFGGYYEGSLIGVMYVLCYKGIIYEWYTGSYYEYLKMCPNSLITWEVLKYGIQNGFNIFDFGGAGSPDKEYGVRDYKRKFGGSEHNTGRFEFVHKPVIMKIAGIGFRIWQALKGKT